MRTHLLLGNVAAAAMLFAPASAIGQHKDFGPALPDRELAEVMGKFVLPNGEALALTITSDTVVNGQAVLRTVLTLDHGSSVQVYGRSPTAAGGSDQPQLAATPTQAPAVTVVFDRQSGVQSISPVVSVATTGMTVNAPVASAAQAGLVELPVATGGPAVATPDGLVSVAAVRGGTQVTLAGDQFSVANLVGPAVATAILNSGNNRSFNTVTNVNIDLQNAAPYQLATGVLRANSLALDATRAMIR